MKRADNDYSKYESLGCATDGVCAKVSSNIVVILENRSILHN